MVSSQPGTTLTPRAGARRYAGSMEGSEVWSRFAHDPRRAEHAHLRASDRDRDIVSAILGDALADGRLTMAELDERTDRLAASRTLGELPALIHDLVPQVSRGPVRVDRFATPAARRAEAERRFRIERRHALMGFLYPSLICLGIWAAVGFGFPWPLFVVLGTGGRTAYLLLNREDRVESIERSLERRHLRAVRAQERHQGRRSLPPWSPPQQ